MINMTEKESQREGNQIMNVRERKKIREERE